MQITNQCSCIVCKEVKSTRAIHTHYLRSHTNIDVERKELNPLPRQVVNFETQKKKWKIYYQSPVRCSECDIELTWFIRMNKTCSHSCAGKHSAKISDKTKRRGPLPKPKLPKEITSPYSVLYRCVCKECNVVWRARSAVQYCDLHKEKYSHAGRAAYWFSFNVYEYPELFDLDNLTKVGFRSKKNPDGMTRDHRVSVQEAIQNNYDPRYIKHQLNCELMPFRQNAAKHTKSSMSYAELVRSVNEYELLLAN